ncbi:MAG TPA: LuxR C-terminal-related transcriptional regulator, partial [Actinomycetes bacterium]|nr:LuxR C-terminal-related transcriptional regulator [Actinomycetes bacterium]
AVSVLADTHEPATVGLALTLQAYLAVQRSDLPGALALLEQASRCANESSDPMLVSRIAIVDGVLRVATGEEVARDEILQLVQGARPFDDNLSSGFSNLAYSDVEFRRLDEAWSVLDESLPLTVEWDLPICHVWQMGARGRLNLIGGDWGAAVLDAEAVLDIPRAPLARTWPSLVRGLVHLRAGDDVETDLDDAWDLAHRLGEPLRLLPAGAAILEREWLLGWADERLPAALAMLDDTSPGLAWARGDLAVWAQRVRPEIPVSHLEVSPVHRLQLEGEYAAAAQRWDQIGDKYEQALALVQAGGQAELRKGIELLDRLGADAVAGKLRKELREQGDVSVPVRRRQSTRSNGAGLTSRETEVLRLLDKGLSNAELASRLFISPKTAGHHVSSILAQLGVADRKQAARAGRELGLIS